MPTEEERAKRNLRDERAAAVRGTENVLPGTPASGKLQNEQDCISHHLIMSTLNKWVGLDHFQPGCTM